MKMMQEDLNLDNMTVTGLPLGQALKFASVTNPACIPTRENAFRKDAGLAVLRGNLAPDGCVVKRAGVNEKMLKCSGLARCFDSEEEALKAVYDGEIAAGEVIVLRYQGPKGGPGMPEMLSVTMALKTRGLNQTALVTDGRFSGATSGPCVGHICPEASDGGLIAFIENGDFIEIDIPACTIHCEIDDEELQRRKTGWQPVQKDVPQGFLRRYRKHVRPSCEGAILD